VGLFQFLVNCTLSDIRPKSIRNQKLQVSDTNKSLELISKSLDTGLQSKNWTQWKKLEIVLVDDWKSSFVRNFTILKNNTTKMKVEIFPNGEMVLEILEGSQKGEIYGIQSGFCYKGLSVTKDNSSSLKTYIESLRLYLLMAINLEKYKFILPVSSEDSSFSIYFATNSEEALSSNSDQYLYYLDAKTGLVSYVQFTYREVFSFYKGFLKLDQYQSYKNKKFPNRIQIQDEIKSKEYVHSIQIEKFLIEE
jgi:hypothetical protein